MVIGFSESEWNDNYVIIQHQSERTDSERKMGWTKYYLEISHGGKGAYNCIASVQLSQNLLMIELFW